MSRDKAHRQCGYLRCLATFFFLLIASEMVKAIVDAMEIQPRTAKDYIRTMRDKAIIEQLSDNSYQLKIF